MAVYVDAGRTFDPLYAARCGVNLDRLLLVRPFLLGATIRALAIAEP
jgi:RecA/RadA recombinase